MHKLGSCIVLAVLTLGGVVTAEKAMANPTKPPFQCLEPYVCLYNLPDYQGTRIRTTVPLPALAHFDDQTSSAFNNQPRTVCFYRDVGYRTLEFSLPPGRGRSLRGTPFDDTISSLRPC